MIDLPFYYYDIFLAAPTALEQREPGRSSSMRAELALADAISSSEEVLWSRLKKAKTLRFLPMRQKVRQLLAVSKPVVRLWVRLMTSRWRHHQHPGFRMPEHQQQVSFPQTVHRSQPHVHPYWQDFWVVELRCPDQYALTDFW